MNALAPTATVATVGLDEAPLRSSRARVTGRTVHERLEDLEQMLKSPEFARRATPRLRACLRDPVTGVRQIAVRLLEGLRDEAVPLLVEATDVNQPRTVRLQAISALGRLAEAAVPATESLVQSLRDVDRDIRWQAAFALARTGESGVMSLMGALEDASVDVREIAAVGLGFAQIGRGSAIERLSRQIQDEGDARVRAACLGSLTRLQDDAMSSAVETQWRDLLHHSDPAIRRNAIIRLGESGESGRPLTKDVLARAADQDQEVRAASVLALARMGCPLPHVQPVIDVSASDESAVVRSRVVIAVSSLRSQDEAWADAMLTQLANDCEPRVALAASAALQAHIETATQETDEEVHHAG